LNPGQYEIYSCFRSANVDDLDRDSDVKLIWRWRKNATLPSREFEEWLACEGMLAENERLFHLATRDFDQAWTLHTASIAWNNYRERWVMMGLKVGNKSSHLNEVYDCEAENLMGPWASRIKRDNHQQYSFYNPRLQPMLDNDGGSNIYLKAHIRSCFQTQRTLTLVMTTTKSWMSRT